MTDDAERRAAPRGGLLRFLPLALFLLVGALFGGYLIAAQFFGYDRDTLPSALIDRPAPDTELAALGDRPPLTDEVLRRPGVKVVNVFASWCVPCRAEHPALMALAERGVPVHGINHRDAPADAEAFLADLGDPFTAVGVDPDGRAGVDWGVYGVPETFVIDGEGRIRYKHVGPIVGDALERQILPAIRAASG